MSDLNTDMVFISGKDTTEWVKILMNWNSITVNIFTYDLVRKVTKKPKTNKIPIVTPTRCHLHFVLYKK